MLCFGILLHMSMSTSCFLTHRRVLCYWSLTAHTWKRQCLDDALKEVLNSDNVDCWLLTDKSHKTKNICVEMKIYAALSLSMPLRKCQPFVALHFTETQREGYFTNTRAYKERLLNPLKGSSESIQCVFLCNGGLSWDVESIEHWLIFYKGKD